MKIAIYSRKSKFTGKGESIQNQIQLCKDYAQQNFNVSDFCIYEDEGFSGGNINRPKFQKMIEDAKLKKFNVIICYRLDRISRNISDFSSLIELLQKSDISFVSIREQFDTSTPMGRAMMYIASVFAQLERETIAERIRDNMHQLARSGRWLGGNCPTGFTSEPITYIDETMKERKMYKLIPIKEELDIVKSLYEKYKEFKSLSKLENYCLRNNIKSKNNKDFQKSSLSDILINPVYAIADEDLYDYFYINNADIAADKSEFNGKYGVMTYNKKLVSEKSVKRKDISDWIIAIGRHEGVLSGKEWTDIQYTLQRNKMKIPRKGTSNNALLSGLIKCKNCGSFFRVGYGPLKENGERYYYYRCNMKDISRGHRCNIRNLPGEQTDQIIINKLKSLVIPRILKSISIDQENKKNELSQLKEIKNKINANEKGIENLVKQLSENENDTVAKYILSEIRNLDEENNSLKKKLNDSDNNKDKFNLEILEESLIKFIDMIDNVGFEEKKTLVQSIIKKIEWDGDNLNIIVCNI